MRHSHLVSHQQRLPSQQRGSSVIIAVFITVVMSLVAISMFRFFRASEHALNIEVLGIRALYAANSGADRALASLYPIDSSSSSPSIECASIDNSQWDIGSDTGLTGFHSCAITIRCQEFTTSLSPALEYQINSTASCGTDACSSSDSFNSCLRVQRSIEVGARED
ncbi:MSHA biogenesis protein MshP [Alginatibacterium sediminis]|uniref:MSHA biogenesis protein MshP n=1 Tax=Alginatibacterium sediminis TaxID=2164068 RepID=A0A420EKZ2_9ALTE|nr:MSHA biogenesis protein MshP [Alginatibacterium sediminis]RKF21367.1 MSHA biogenesis protein MshP [Alginatibacterium sediminis]